MRAKPVVELFPLYRLVEGCVVKVRWSSEKPRLEEAYLIILRRAKKLDFAATLRGTKILITPEEVEMPNELQSLMRRLKEAGIVVCT